LSRLLLVFGAALAALPATAAAQESLIAMTDRLAAEVLRSSKAPGLAIALVRNDSVVLAKGYGRRRSTGSEQVDERTLFGAGGLTKGLNAGLIATLVDEGKLKWDDPVRAHLAAFRLSEPWVTQQVTIRDLLLSRFGLTRGDTILKPGRSLAQVLAQTAQLPVTDFRARFGASGNLVNFLAGELAAAEGHQPWADLLRDRLLTPLGMTATTSHFSAVQSSSNVALPHNLRGDSLTQLELANIEYMGGAAALYSNAVDVAAWLRLQLGRGRFAGRQVISEASLREMQTPLVVSSVGNFRGFFNRYASVIGFGMGWHVSDYRGQTVIENGGIFGGYFNYILLLPAQNFGLSILANIGPTLPIWNPVQDMKFALLDQVIGASAPPLRKFP
jgi:CubicO group peptidase (beta-lactamase class C family)